MDNMGQLGSLLRDLQYKHQDSINALQWQYAMHWNFK